jgi:hypothetical protein
MPHQKPCHRFNVVARFFLFSVAAVLIAECIDNQCFMGYSADESAATSGCQTRKAISNRLTSLMHLFS